MTPMEILKRPYSRVVVPEPDGSYRAHIAEFPGCIASGSTPAEAYASLERVAESWLELTLDKGQPIPDPLDSAEGYSGRIVLRMPKSLHAKAAFAAKNESVSLNQFIVSSVAEMVGAARSHANRVQTIAFGTVAGNFPRYQEKITLWQTSGFGLPVAQHGDELLKLFCGSSSRPESR